MDGHASTAALGILYAEDFGSDQREPRPAPKPAPAAPAPPPPPPPPPPIVQADIDAACIRAVQAAERAWAGSAEDRRAEALSALAAGLAEARQEAAHHAEAVADGIAKTILSLLSGILPHFCRDHGDAEVRALLTRLAPLIAPSMRLVVRVHPDLIDPLLDDIAALDDNLVDQIELRPANLPPGDVRLSWEDGRLVRDTAAICTALAEGLSALGLSAPPTLITHPRSLELAQ